MPVSPISARLARFPRRFRLLVSLAALALGVSEARAADEDVEEDAPVHAFTRSIAVSPLVFIGQLYANYEHLLGLRHGLLAEGGYAFVGPSSGSWSASAGYRYHFSRGLEGLFAGAFLRTGAIATEAELDVDGDKIKYGVEGPLTALGANLGYRWQWGNGVAMTLRGGYGYPFLSDIEWTPDDGQEQGLKDFVEGFFGLDLELSAGYSF